MSCSRCHVIPPKLNVVGETFLANGYALPAETRRTIPLALWLSGRSEALPNVAEQRSYVNRAEVIAGGKATAELSYFVEWRPLSLETRGNGSLRDRSGRFEDFFFTLTARSGRSEVTLGQFRPLSQFDVSRRLSLAEPLVVSSSLTTPPTNLPRGLSNFSPAGRSPALRFAYHQALSELMPLANWRWTTALTLPVPGELSLPLTDEARREASFELDLDLKGLFLESYVRWGLFSLGGHVFHGGRDFYLAHAVTTGTIGPWHWTVMGGIADDGVARGRWSLEAEYLPTWAGAGLRVENQGVDPLGPAVLGFVNAHFPGSRYTIRLTVEQRIQRDRNATIVELGTVF